MVFWYDMEDPTVLHCRQKQSSLPMNSVLLETGYDWHQCCEDIRHNGILDKNIDPRTQKTCLDLLLEVIRHLRVLRLRMGMLLAIPLSKPKIPSLEVGK